MAALDPKKHLHDFIQRASRLLANDIKAIDHCNCTLCPGEHTRPAVHIVAECATLNHAVAGYLTTGAFNRPPLEERIAHLAKFDTREKALNYLEEGTALLLAAVETLDVNTLGDVDSPMGRPMSRFAIAELPANHMMYHDGQLNYIQTFFGDKEMHW